MQLYSLCTQCTRHYYDFLAVDHCHAAEHALHSQQAHDHTSRANRFRNKNSEPDAQSCHQRRPCNCSHCHLARRPGRARPRIWWHSPGYPTTPGEKKTGAATVVDSATPASVWIIRSDSSNAAVSTLRPGPQQNVVMLHTGTDTSHNPIQPLHPGFGRARPWRRTWSHRHGGPPTPLSLSQQILPDNDN